MDKTRSEFKKIFPSASISVACISCKDGFGIEMLKENLEKVTNQAERKKKWGKN